MKQYSLSSNHRYLYRELWKYDKKKLLFSLSKAVLSIIVAFLGVWVPSYIIRCLEQKLPFMEIVWQIFAVALCFGLLEAAHMYVSNRTGWLYLDFGFIHMYSKLVKKMLTMDFCVAEKEETQRLKAKAEESFWGRNYGIQGVFMNDTLLLENIGKLVLYIICLSRVEPVIVGVLLVNSLLQMAGLHIEQKKEFTHKEEMAQIKVEQRYIHQQAYNNTIGKDIRLYQLGGWLSQKYDRIKRRFLKLQNKELRFSFGNRLFGTGLQLARDIVCYGYLLKNLWDGMSVSDFVLYAGMIAGFGGFFSEIAEDLEDLFRDLKLTGYFREYITLPQELKHGEGIVLKKDGEGLKIEFSHVSFSYPGTEKKVLDDVSFVMHSGKKTALVGINGAGKSTIVKLLCGFYPVTEGHITINGIDINALDLEAYYEELAVVFQETFYFSFSIASNITGMEAGREDKAYLDEILHRVGLKKKTDSLPKKAYTYLNKDVEEDGIQLSGGEMQKLLLARALYKNSRLLLLDEPTAAMDAIAENEVYESYDELTRGKTALFISHRLASTRFCDEILYLENGKITERGTHEKLLEQNGSYAKMFEVQSKYYIEGQEVDKFEEAVEGNA